jgi:hypothetical protein
MQEMAMVLERDRKLVEAQVKDIQDRMKNLNVPVHPNSVYFMGFLNYAGGGHPS